MLVFNVAGCVRDNLVLCKVNKITWKVSVSSIPVDRDDLIIWRQSNFTKGDHTNKIDHGNHTLRKQQKEYVGNVHRRNRSSVESSPDVFNTSQLYGI